MTGATGFLGEYTVEEFLKQGYQVIAVGRNEQQGKRLVEKGATFIKVDLRNKEEVEKCVAQADYVVHGAALSTVWGSWDDFYAHNVQATQNVLEACHKHHVKRFVFVSSPSVYSCKEDRLNIKEEDFNVKNELNYYIKSKILAEKCVQDYEEKGLYTVVIRPRGLFGVGDPSILPRLLEANKQMGIPLFNQGSNLVDMTYVGNVALALRLCIEAEDVSGEVFNITNDEPIAFKTLLEQAFAAIGEPVRYKQATFKKFYGIAAGLEAIYKVLRINKEPPVTKYTVCTLATSQTLDIAKAKVKLGYKPITTVKEGIENYGKWYKSSIR